MEDFFADVSKPPTTEPSTAVKPVEDFFADTSPKPVVAPQTNPTNDFFADAPKTEVSKTEVSDRSSLPTPSADAGEAMRQAHGGSVIPKMSQDQILEETGKGLPAAKGVSNILKQIHAEQESGITETQAARLQQRESDRQKYADTLATMHSQFKGAEYDKDHPLIKAGAEGLMNADQKNQLPEDVTSEQEHTFNRIMKEGTDYARPKATGLPKLLGIDSPTAEDTIYNFQRPIVKELSKAASLRPTLGTEAIKGILPLIKILPNVAAKLNPFVSGEYDHRVDGFNNAIDNLRDWVSAADAELDRKIDRKLPESIPEMQGRQQGVTKVGNIISSVIPMLALPAVVGLEGTASIFALSTGSNVYDAARAGELKRQVDNGEALNPLKANNVATVHEALTLPLSYFLNVNNPITKSLAEGKAFGDTVINKVYRGALTNATLTGVDATWQQALKYAPVIGSKDIQKSSSILDALFGDGTVVDQTLTSAATGAFLGPFTSHVQQERDNTARNINDRLTDGAIASRAILGRGQLEVRMKQYGIKPDGPIMDVMEGLVKAQASVTGRSPQEFYSELYRELGTIDPKNTSSKLVQVPKGVDQKDFIEGMQKKTRQISDIWNMDEGAQKFKFMVDTAFRNVPDTNMTELLDKGKEWLDSKGLKYKDDQDVSAFLVAHYINSDRAPTGDLAKPVSDAAKIVGNWYMGLRGLKGSSDMPVGVERLMDGLFAMEDPLSVGKANTYEQAQQKFEYVKNEYVQAQKNLKGLKATVDPSVTINPDEVAVYHGTNSEEQFTTLNILSHVGTEAAAKAALGTEQTSNARILSGALRLGKVVDFTDTGIAHTPVKLAAVLEKEGILPKYASNAVSAITDIAKQKDAIITMLRRKGIDTLRYTNVNEDKGSVSYITTHPDQFRVVQGTDPIKVYEAEQLVNTKHGEAIEAKKTLNLTREQFANSKTARIVQYADKSQQTQILRQTQDNISTLLANQSSKQTTRQSNLFRLYNGSREMLRKSIGRIFVNQELRLSKPIRDLVSPMFDRMQAMIDGIVTVSRKDIKLVAEGLQLKSPDGKQTLERFLEEPIPGTLKSRGMMLREEWNYGKNHGVPNWPEVREYRALVRQIGDYSTAMARDSGMLRKLPSGDILPVNQDDIARSVRALSENGYKVLDDGGVAAENWKKALAKENLIAENTPEHKEFTEMFEDMVKGRNTIARNGMLEKSRLLKKMVDYTRDEHGNLIDMLHVNPIQHLNMMAHKTGVRIGVVQNFGQGLLENLTELADPKLPHQGDVAIPAREAIPAQKGKKAVPARAAKPGTFGKMHNEAYATTVRLLKSLDLFENKETGTYRDQKLVEQGYTYENLATVSKEDREILADSLGIVRTNDPEAIRQQFMEVTSKDINSKLLRVRDKILHANENSNKTEPEIKLEIQLAQQAVMRDIKGIAQKIGGVDTRSGNDMMLAGLKKRLQYDSYDMVIEHLETLLAKTGDLKAFDSMMMKVQGIPVGPQTSDRQLGGAVGVIKSVNDVYGSMLISRSFFANLTQPLQLAAEVGPTRTVKAIGQVLFGDLDHAAINAGIIGESLGAMGVQTRAWYRHAGAQFKNALGKLTGVDWINDFNQLVTAKAVSNLVDEIRSKGLSEGARMSLKRVRMTPEEMTRIEGRDIDRSLYTRMALQYIRATQYVGLSTYNRADILNYPVLRLVMPLQTYLTETLKHTALIANDWQKHTLAFIQNPKGKGNFNRAAAANQSMINWLIATRGGAFVGNMLIQGLQGSPPKREELEDQNFWDECYGFLAQSGVTGPLARMVGNVDYSQGSAYNYAFTFAPVASSFIKSMTIMSGLGDSKWKNEPFYRRLLEGVSQATPILKDMRMRYEYTMYPQAYDYDEMRGKAAVWRKVQDKLNNKYEQNARGGAINPDYEPIFDALRRGDMEHLKGLVSDYYQTQIKKASKYDVNPAQTASQALSSSLMSRAPIPFGDPDKPSIDRALFLRSLKKSDLLRYYQRDREYRDVVKQIAPY